MHNSRLFASLIAVGLLVGVSNSSALQPNKAEPLPPPALLVAGVADPRWGERLEVLSDAVKGSDWAKTTQLLQQCFAAPQGVIAPVVSKDADGKEIKRYVGLRSEALRRLAELPPPGRAAYREAAEQPAATLLADLRKDGNLDKPVNVYLQYPGTKAATEVLREEAGRQAAAGHFQLALVTLAHLERQNPSAYWPTDLLVEAAILYRRVALLDPRPDHRDKAEALAKRAGCRKRLSEKGFA
jgi:hypothetical protein